MTRVTFAVAVHGREDLTKVCLRQLARTCESVADYDLLATAIIVGEGPILDYAYEFGFGTVERDNDFLGRKMNDAYQLACDPEFNPEPADYVVPCGSDDWVDPVILRELPTDAIGTFRLIAIVNEEQTQMMKLSVGYKGGAGVRIIPRSFLEATGFRPSDEDRPRAVDNSTVEGMKYALGHFPALQFMDVHPLQIVDWKTHGTQLNTYKMLGGYRRGVVEGDFWDLLAEHYPAESVEEMRVLRREAVAA